MAKKIVFSVVGARPHFIKAAPFMSAMKNSSLSVFTVHTGQHYDANMSDLFFRELGLPNPDVNLGVGSGSHAQQTSKVMTLVEQLILEHKPEAVMVYGDTNTTLGAALAATKLYVPTIHIEAGVRCGNKRYPEEINRIIIDHISDYLACPSQLAVQNLLAEGVTKGVEFTGDVMYDIFLETQRAVSSYPKTLEHFGLEDGPFILATLHRENTTREPAALAAVLDEIGRLSLPVLLPIHPRTRTAMIAADIPLDRRDGLRIIDPVGYLDIVFLLSQCSLVLTDSGGLEKEAYWSGKPCVSLLDETTWPETVDAGWNVLTGLNPIAITRSVERYLSLTPEMLGKRTELYGPPGAAKRVLSAMGWI